MNKPLIEIMENARTKTVGAVNQIIQESGLPAYLMEGILVGIVSDIRNQKNSELIRALQQKEACEKEVSKEEEKTKEKETLTESKTS